MKIHKSLVRKKRPEKENLNFKLLPKEVKEIRAIAKKFTKGNVTALIRLSTKAYKPSAKDLVTIKS